MSAGQQRRARRGARFNPQCDFIDGAKALTYSFELQRECAWLRF
jgi:hypothetical protein